jgi:CBS domain-containing protein
VAKAKEGRLPVVQYNLTFGDILRVKGGSIITIRPDKSVVEAAQLLKSKRIGILMVAEETGKVIGVLSERDLVGALAKYGNDAPQQTVREIMTKRIVVCQPFDSARQVMMTMKNKRFRHMPVMQDGIFKGLISIGDILHHLLEHDQLEEEKNILANL